MNAEQIQELWRRAERGEFNGDTPVLEPRAFVGVNAFAIQWHYDARRAYLDWLERQEKPE